MTKHKIGYHTEITGPLYSILKTHKNIPIQFFIKDIQSDKFLEKAKQYTKNAIVHSSYTINIATEFNIYSLSTRSLLNETKIAEELNINNIVIHTGKQLTQQKPKAINNMYQTLLYILQETEKINILIETPSGQGTELCTTIEEYIYFFKKFNSPRIKLCIDTCHIFAAGYDIIDYIEKLKTQININSIGLIHLNDSKYPQGSKKDRHAKPGEGYIGKTKLKEFLKNIPSSTPIILEN